MRISSSIFISSAVVLLTACGGGGGDDSESIRNISGQWGGSLTQASDQCGGAPATIDIAHAVSQNEDAVSLTSEAGVVFLGNMVGPDGFSVDGSHSTIGNANCSDSTRIEYDKIADDDDTLADVVVTIDRSCSGRAPCQIVYNGVASRAGNVAVNPTPGVTPGATPITRGACSQMNPNPAAGTYAGDGGCGISDTAFRVNQNTVVLEPFGANGATSFGVSASDGSTASTARSDLTIGGVAGYSCAMACSPPGTFTVSCFKEGGTSCEEKF